MAGSKSPTKSLNSTAPKKAATNIHPTQDAPKVCTSAALPETAQVMSKRTPHVTPAPALHFFEIPPEICNEIYIYVVKTLRDDCGYSSCSCAPSHFSLLSAVGVKGPPSITRISRQLRYEVLAM